MISTCSKAGMVHIELVYDFSGGGEGRRVAACPVFAIVIGKAAMPPRPVFGAHVFNTILTYRDEPQSLPTGASAGIVDPTVPQARRAALRHDLPSDLPRRPGLGSRRVTRTSFSTNSAGCEVARSHLAIPCSGYPAMVLSKVVRRSDPAPRAGTGAYVIVRDTTCRLFGYHGPAGAAMAPFSLDHMFRILARGRIPLTPIFRKKCYILAVKF